MDNIKLSNVLILRDPQNLFASRIRKSNLVDFPCYSTDEQSLRRVTELWKTHALEFLGITNQMEPQKVCIYYNAWFSSETYRRQISRQLNLKFTDKGLGKVSSRGGESSFDGTRFNGQSSGMDVLEQHRQLTDDEQVILQEMLDDTELLELAKQVKEMYGSNNQAQL